MTSEQEIKSGYEGCHKRSFVMLPLSAGTFSTQQVTSASNVRQASKLNSFSLIVTLQVISQFECPPKLLILFAQTAFCPPTVVTIRGQCRNTGIDFASRDVDLVCISGQLPFGAFGELNALQRLHASMAETALWVIRAQPTRHETANKYGGVDMYSTKSMNGVPTIQRNGRNILGVWDEDWEFASELCKLLNDLDEYPALLLNEHDRDWLKAMNRAFAGRMQHA